MKEAAYRTLIDHICIPGSPSEWRYCLELIPSFTLKQRKALLLLGRAQYRPDPYTQLYNLVAPYISDLLMDRFFLLYNNSFSAGLLLTMTRCAPLLPGEMNEAFKSAVLKERKPMDHTGLPNRLNFNVFFGSPNESVAPGTLPNPPMARYVQNAVDNWISKQERTIHYPKLSRKTTSEETQTLCTGLFYKMDKDYNVTEPITQVSVEKIYHTTGIKVGGGCELRQRWYPSQLLPRTYFAAGGEAFHQSKHIAKMMTDLNDEIPCTNRRSRVNPTRLRMKDGHHAYIYDLSAFTSNLHEQRHFVSRLALYCRGHNVTIMDAVAGLIQYDLGDLIDEYNQTNIQSPYTMNRVYGKAIPPAAHHTAGFLGVYGNIANATFLHGIVMLQLCDNEEELNVAGDDGIKDSLEDDPVFELLRFLGLLEPSKVFFSHEAGCVHLKRPIRQMGNRLYQGFITLWPSFEYLAVDNSDVDPRYPLILKATKSERRDALASSITGFLTSLSTTTLEDWMVDIADSVLRFCYSALSLPLDGHIPQIHGLTYGFIPQYDRRFIGLEPKTNTIKRLYQGIAKVPFRIRVGWDEDQDLTLGYEFRANSSKLLVYLEDLGYLEKKPIQQFVYGEDGLERLLKEYLDPEPAVYEYTVIQEVPSQFLDRYQQ